MGRDIVTEAISNVLKDIWSKPKLQSQKNVTESILHNSTKNIWDYYT